MKSLYVMVWLLFGFGMAMAQDKSPLTSDDMRQRAVNVAKGLSCTNYMDMLEMMGSDDRLPSASRTPAGL